MNPFVTVPAFIKIFYQLHQYNVATVKDIDKCRALEDYEGERAIILKNVQTHIKKMAEILHVDFDVEGYENLPESGPVVIYSNHQGFADVLAIFNVFNKFQIGFVAKDEYTSWGPLATAIKYSRSIFLKRGDARAAIETIKETTALLNKGFSLCIFPEGTRSRGPVPGEFKAGAFKFAQKAKVPVIPVTIDDAYKMFEIDGSFHPCTVKVKIHPVVHIENMDRREQVAAWDQIVHTICEPLLNNQNKEL